MNNSETKRNMEGDSRNMIKCAICGEHFNANEAFSCPKCKKGPLCRKHRITGRKECLSCSFDVTLKEVNILRGQEKHIKGFINFLQFLFIAFAIIFIASTFGLLEEIAYFKENLIINNISYFGIGTAVLLIIFYLIVSNQKHKIEKIEAELGKIGGKRY
jgi:hypothetical protein